MDVSCSPYKAVAILRLTTGQLRALLACKCNINPARSERQSTPLSRRDAIDHDAILVAKSCYRAPSSDSCARSGRDIIAAEVSDIAQVMHGSASSDPRRTDIHH